MLSVALAALAFGSNTPKPGRSPKATMATSEFALGLPGVTEFPGPFDPLGFSEKASPALLRQYREAELTHGRVAMLASVGFLVQEKFHPLFGGSVTGPAITHIPQIPEFFWFFLAVGIGAAEAERVKIGFADPLFDKQGRVTGKAEETLKPNYTPGDLGFDPLGIRPKDPAAFAEMQTKELNNGRLAMIAAAGFLAQEAVDGKGIWEHLGL